MSAHDPIGNPVMMYGVPPIDEQEPFGIGRQAPPPGMPSPPFTVATGGQEPIEQLVSRMRSRVEWLRAEIAKVDALRDELALLEKMLAPYTTPEAR